MCARPAERPFSHSSRSPSQPTARCGTPCSDCRTPRRSSPPAPARRRPLRWLCRHLGLPFERPAGVARLPSSPRAAVVTSLISSTPLQRSHLQAPTTVAALAHSAHASQQLSLLRARLSPSPSPGPSPAARSPRLGVRAAASPATAPGLPASPSRALATTTPSVWQHHRSMADMNQESIQQKIQIARRDAEALKDRIKRKKDELADTTRTC